MSDHYGTIAINANNSATPPKTPQKSPSQEQRKEPKKNGSPLLFPLITLFLVVGYFLTGIYLIPLAIQKYLPQYIETQGELNLSIDRVQLNPINFQLSLEGLTIDPQKGAATEPLLKIKSLIIDLDFTSLIRSSFTCDKLTIDELQLNLVRYKDKHYNIPTLSFFSNTEDKGDIISFAKLPFLFSLNNIDISNSLILFNDSVADKFHIIKELQLAIPTLSNFDFQSKNYIHPHFSAIINDSPIQLSGEAVQLPNNQGFQTNLSCNIQSLDLVQYFSYLPSSFPYTLSKGKADTSFQLSFAPDKRQGDRLSIDIKLNGVDIEMNTKDTDLRMSIPALKLDAVITPASRNFHIKDLITKKIELWGSQEQINSTLQKLFFHRPSRSQTPPTIHIDRFLTDESKVILVANNPDDQTSTSTWTDLQITIKNFNSVKSTGTFHISGEHENNKGSFSWQGRYNDPQTIDGKLLLNEFPASTLFRQILAKQDEPVNGTATFSGDLAFHDQTKTSPGYSINGAILQFHNLELLQDKSKWLKADSIRFTRFSKTDKRYTLGNIFLKGTTLTLNSDRLPPLFKQLFTTKQHPLITGIDFSGLLNITNSSKQKKPLQISDIHFQTNRLEKKSSTENFAFSGHLAEKGIIKAKGILNLAPVEIIAQMAFSDLNSQIFSPLFTKHPLLFNSKSLIHGRGVYRFPSPSFQGNLKFTDTLLQIVPDEPLLQWNSAELNNVSCLFSPFSLQVDAVSFTSPQLQWHRSAESAFKDFQKGLEKLTKNYVKDKTLFPIEIKKANFKNGLVSIVDSRLSPAWSTKLNTIEGRINNLNTNSHGLSTFTMTANTENSPVTASGSITLEKDTLEAHARVIASGLPLKTFFEQLRLFPIKTGNATIDLELNLNENASKFSSKNDILIKNLQVPAKLPNAALALAFLNDANNSFPLHVEINDGGKSLLKEALTNFQTTIIKASYAPLLLDRRFKDLQNNNLISFEFGSNRITPDGREILGRYAELLKEHPRLSFTLTGMTDSRTDREALQKTATDAEQKRVDALNTQGLMAHKKRQQKMLSQPAGEILKEENIPQKDLAGFKAIIPKKMQINDSDLIKLANKRNLLVYDYFVHSLGVAPRYLNLTKKAKISDDTLAHGVRIKITTAATPNN